MNVGIVGHAAEKFTLQSAMMAKNTIRSILNPGDVVVSGHSPMGGIDIWAEDVANEMGLRTEIFEPKQHTWEGTYGFKKRNIDIALHSDIVHVIVVDSLPPGFTGKRFKRCYHCDTDEHVKSGGCWTGWEARKLGKKAVWHIVRQVMLNA